MKNKNITFISLNYAPEDTAIGLYSTQWVEFLQKAGYNVTVVTAFPYYPQWEISDSYKDKSTYLEENMEGIKILRYKQYVPKNPSFLKRTMHLIDFALGSLYNLYKIKKSDLVISIVPSTTSVLLGYIQKKRFKSKIWMHIQDFEFDAALEAGVGKKKNVFFLILFKFEKWLFSKSDISSTISKNMLSRLSEKTDSEKFFLPNWIDNKKIDPNNCETHPYLKTNKMKLLYSGSIGDKQDWINFIRFCEDVDDKKYDIFIVGDGSKKNWVRDQIKKLDNVYYYPPVPFSQLSDLLCSADVHLLFQKTTVIDTVMPSKVLGMMASAKPSIIIGNPKSEVKSIFDESKAGFYFPEYSKDVIETLDEISKNKTLYIQNGKECRAYVIEHFSKEKILNKMLDRLQNL